MEGTKGARVFQSPTRYVQKAGLVRQLGPVVQDTFPKLSKPSVLISKRSRTTPAGQQLISSLKDPVVYEYEAECCRAAVDSVAASFRSMGVDHVVSFGGGKIVDAGKLVAEKLEAKSIIVPSIASNDSPCTALSVLYTEQGQFDEYVFFKKSPDMVLVDTEVILQSPARFLISGLGDAMSTYYEARACSRNPLAWSLITPFTYRPPVMAMAIGRQCRDILFEHGPAALKALQNKKMDAAFEDVVEANILLSGLGAESGGLAAAHAIHNGLAELPETHGSLHGEKVAFGTLCQLMMEGDREEAARVATFCKQVGLPTRFQDMGITDVTEAKLRLVANHCMDPSTTMWNVGPHVTHELIIDAMKQADALGQSMEAQPAASR